MNFDCNSTLTAIDIASNKLNWYIGFSILSSIISVSAVSASIYFNRKQLEESNKRHYDILKKQEDILKANHDWNRRSFTIEYLGESIDKIQEIRKELNELTSKVGIKGIKGNSLSFSDRFIRGNALTEEEIHDWICEWDEEKKEFVKEKSDGEDFKLTQDGDKIRILLITLLNTYESIGAAMINRVLDKEVVISLMKGPIVSNYKFFILWTKHLRKKHGLKNAGKNFRDLYRVVSPKKEKGLREKTENI